MLRAFPPAPAADSIPRDTLAGSPVPQVTHPMSGSGPIRAILVPATDAPAVAPPSGVPR